MLVTLLASEGDAVMVVEMLVLVTSTKTVTSWIHSVPYGDSHI